MAVPLQYLTLKSLTESCKLAPAAPLEINNQATKKNCFRNPLFQSL